MTCVTPNLHHGLDLINIRNSSDKSSKPLFKRILSKVCACGNYRTIVGYFGKDVSPGSKMTWILGNLLDQMGGCARGFQRWW